MAGSLDQPTGSSLKRIIKIVDITNQTPSNIESTFNMNFGSKGWKIIQFFTIATKNYLLAEKEII